MAVLEMKAMTTIILANYAFDLVSKDQTGLSLLLPMLTGLSEEDGGHHDEARGRLASARPQDQD